MCLSWLLAAIRAEAPQVLLGHLPTPLPLPAMMAQHLCCFPAPIWAAGQPAFLGNLPLLPLPRPPHPAFSPSPYTSLCSA
jgi:hypothetical protein